MCLTGRLQCAVDISSDDRVQRRIVFADLIETQFQRFYSAYATFAQHRQPVSRRLKQIWEVVRDFDRVLN